MVEDTLAALQNPSALLGSLREPLAAIYQELLAQAKMEKAASARNRVSSLGRQGLKAGAWEAMRPDCLLRLEGPKLLREMGEELGRIVRIWKRRREKRLRGGGGLR